MNDYQKQRLTQLRATSFDSLSDVEKKELEMLETIEKMEKQIVEKDSMIGKRDTELDNLKRDLAKMSDGKDKTALEERIKEKEEALEIAKAGLQALKDAQKTNLEHTKTFPSQAPEHGEPADPDEIARLQKAARANDKIKAAVETAVNNMTDEQYNRYKSDPKFKLAVLKEAIPDGDIGVRSPWDDETETKGAPPKSDEDSIKELFGRQVRNGRQLPPGISGRPGQPGRVGGIPPTNERLIDTRTY